MPVRKKGRHWYMGKRKFKTKAAALRAYQAYLARKKKRK